MKTEKRLNEVGFLRPEDIKDFKIESIGDDFSISDFPLSCINIPSVSLRMQGLVFALCVSGEGQFMVNLKKYKVKKNDIFILPPGQVIQYIDRSDDFSIHSMFMSAPFFADNTSLPRNRDMTVFFTIRDNPCFNLSEEEVDVIMQYHALISNRIKDKNNPFLLDTMRYIVNALLTEMKNILEKYFHNQKKNSSRKDDICREFMKLLMANYKNSRQVSFYADKLFLTPKYLSNTLKQVTGRKAGELIDEYVILQAKVLLLIGISGWPKFKKAPDEHI
ncbi:MAG: AraC family ligand binding domain-containing protein, partial [Flavobacteriales bacterium]|nr:AraC family ligand binding domain-containing protein [Flavobacteriales bacterium]